MAEIRIYVDDSMAVIQQQCDLTVGMIGAKAIFEFSDNWENLIKTVVFRTDHVTKDVLLADKEVIIPAEVLTTANESLHIGVYGISEDGKTAIPTKWALTKMVYSGAKPSGDISTDPTLPVWAQIQTQIGDLKQLNTENRESLVAAINEKSDSSGDAVPAYIQIAAEAVAEKIISVTGESSFETIVEASYTNQIPISVDADGSVFGYKEEWRLSSSGVAKAVTEDYYAGIDCTGFIPCKANDIIRFRGITWNKDLEQASGCYIWLYDENFSTVGAITAPYATQSNGFTLDAAGNITQWTVNISSGDMSTVRYLRINGYDIGADSIITVNEEIGNAGGTIVMDTSAVAFNMAFLPDLHWCAADESRYKAAAQALRVIAETASIDLVCFGGDYTLNWKEESAQDAREDIRACRRTFAQMPAPSIWLRGNHENNGYAGQRLPRQEIFNRISRIQSTLPGYVSNPNDPYGCYGYLDFEGTKTRVIAVNTSDNDQMGTTVTAEGTTADLINCHNIGAVQLQWIADYALDLSEKETPGDWTILIVSHIPIFSVNSWYNSHNYTDDEGKTWTCNVVNLQTLMEAYRDQSSFSVSLNGETAAKNFAGSEPAGAILFVNGHGHNLEYLSNNGFTYVACPNVCNNGETESIDGTAYKKGAAGTAQETSVTVLTLDSANRKAYVWIYGAGNDCIIDY